MTHDNSPKWRTQFTPWKSAGNLTETGGTADEVVRQTGWVFNNETGSDLTLADFVRTGDEEVGRYLRQFGFSPESLANKTLLEIGSGIGRMTAAFTKQCFAVVAADVEGHEEAEEGGDDEQHRGVARVALQAPGHEIGRGAGQQQAEEDADPGDIARHVTVPVKVVMRPACGRVVLAADLAIRRCGAVLTESRWLACPASPPKSRPTAVAPAAVTRSASAP